MEKDYKQLLNITAGIVETARKNKGMTQKELADYLGVIQSTVSRIELGSLSPTLFHWMEMCKILNIPHDAISVGYLDRCTLTKITSDRVEGGYTLPKAYAVNKCIKVRGLLPMLKYIQKDLGEKVYLNILNNLKMKPTFFVNLDNQVNVNFIKDFLEALGDNIKINNRTKAGIFKHTPLEESHGALSTVYKNADNQMDLMERYITNFSKYCKFYTLEIDKVKPDQIKLFSGVAEPIQNDLFYAGREIDDLIWSLFESYLQKFSLFQYKHQDGKPKEILINSTERDQSFRRMVTFSVA